MDAPKKRSRHAKKSSPNEVPLVIRHGHAELMPGGRIKYHWDAIFELWQAWPDANLESFARAWGIGYSAITKKQRFSVAAKRRQVESAVGRRGFRERVIRSITLCRGNIATDPAQILAIINELMACAEANAKIIKSRMVKIQPDGTSIANACLSNSELAKLAAAIKDTTQSIKELMFLAASVPDENADTGIKDEPRPEIIGRIGAAS